MPLLLLLRHVHLISRTAQTEAYFLLFGHDMLTFLLIEALVILRLGLPVPKLPVTWLLLVMRNLFRFK